MQPNVQKKEEEIFTVAGASSCLKSSNAFDTRFEEIFENDLLKYLRYVSEIFENY